MATFEKQHNEIRTAECLRKSILTVNSSVSSTAITESISLKPLVPVKFSDFDVITLLGEGSFGKVFKVCHKESG
jgi:hypothetical protein